MNPIFWSCWVGLDPGLRVQNWVRLGRLSGNHPGSGPKGHLCGRAFRLLSHRNFTQSKSGFKIRLVRVGLASKTCQNLSSNTKIYLVHLNEHNFLVMLGRVGPWPQGPKSGQAGSALRVSSRPWPGRASA